LAELVDQINGPDGSLASALKDVSEETETLSEELVGEGGLLD
jgi:hypothetical protein